MKILIDDQFFSQQIYGGISRYHYELYQHLNRIINVKCNISALYTYNEYLKKDPQFHNILLRPLFFSKKITRKINRQFSIHKLHSQNFDVFHPTYYDPYFLKYLHKKPFVITIHDMIPEYFSEYFKSDALIENKKILIDKAEAIIAVSSNTKKDLIDFYKVKEKKITVIHHGFNSINKGDKTEQIAMNLPQEFILYVGERGDYKNFTFFLESVTNTLIKFNISLVCAGGRTFSEKERNLINKAKIEHLIHQYDASDEQLNYMYSKALLFAFPTLYEGFGIPILEAFHNECPVMASNRGSIPEIAGNGAVYFDPTDPINIKETLESLINNKPKLEELKLHGSQIIKLYDWEKTAIETLKVYEAVI